MTTTTCVETAPRPIQHSDLERISERKWLFRNEKCHRIALSNDDLLNGNILFRAVNNDWKASWAPALQPETKWVYFEGDTTGVVVHSICLYRFYRLLNPVRTEAKYGFFDKHWNTCMRASLDYFMTCPDDLVHFVN